MTRVVKIDVKAKTFAPHTLAVVATSPFSMHLIKAIDPRSQVIVFSFGLTLHCLHWPTTSYWKVVLDEDQDELVSLPYIVNIMPKAEFNSHSTI